MLALQELKLKDYDKYLAVLLAPKIHQRTLTALFLFGHEIAQIPAEVSEPMIGLIKLQWWQDALDEIINNQPARPHPILKNLVSPQINYAHLQNVIAQYVNVVEGYQPKTVEEIESFLRNTDCIILEQAVNITNGKYEQQLALSYALNAMGRKIFLNAKYYTKFASQPEILAKILIEKSTNLLPKSNNIFAVITRHYNKNPNSPRWKLLLTLLFKR